MDFNDLAFGTNEHRREPAHRRNYPEDMTKDVMDMGKMAVGGMVTVGVIGALGSAFNK